MNLSYTSSTNKVNFVVILKVKQIFVTIGSIIKYSTYYITLAQMERLIFLLPWQSFLLEKNHSVTLQISCNAKTYIEYTLF